MNSNKMFKIISPKDIEYNLIHTKQIVFEITDKCNLSCKYCGYADLLNFRKLFIPLAVVVLN